MKTDDDGVQFSSSAGSLNTQEYLFAGIHLYFYLMKKIGPCLSTGLMTADF